MTQKNPEKNDTWTTLSKIAAPIVGIILVLYMCNNMNEDPTPSSDEQYHQVGESFEVESVIFNVSEIERLEGEDNDTIIVKYLVENHAKEEVSISSGLVKIVDDQDKIYDSDWDSDWPGSLNPGLHGTGKARFEIPKDARGLIVSFRTAMFDFGGAKYEYVKLE